LIYALIALSRAVLPKVWIDFESCCEKRHNKLHININKELDTDNLGKERKGFLRDFYNGLFIPKMNLWHVMLAFFS